MTTVDQQLANLVIRQYRSLDHEEVVQLYLNGMRSYSFEGEDEASKTLWEQVRQASVNSDLADIEGVYLTSGGNFWVAVVSSSDREEEVIAMVGLQLHSGDLGELRCMSVKEGYRRVGLGRKLLKHLEDWAQTHGLKRVKLSTGMTMTRAVQFYMAHGYTLTHTTIFTPEMPHEEAHLAKDL
ncbi:N-acetyltransferase CML2 [Phytophthora nicotianae]|nr:N-acetyltransferase CML2 [Phytophthora nicotianae]